MPSLIAPLPSFSRVMLENLAPLFFFFFQLAAIGPKAEMLLFCRLVNYRAQMRFTTLPFLFISRRFPLPFLFFLRTNARSRHLRAFFVEDGYEYASATFPPLFAPALPSFSFPREGAEELPTTPSRPRGDPSLLACNRVLRCGRTFQKLLFSFFFETADQVNRLFPSFP